MALLLAVLDSGAFGRLSSDSEIIAMRASGDRPLSSCSDRLLVSRSCVFFVTLGLSVYAQPWEIPCAPGSTRW